MGSHIGQRGTPGALALQLNAKAAQSLDSWPMDDRKALNRTYVLLSRQTIRDQAPWDLQQVGGYPGTYLPRRMYLQALKKL